MKNRFLLLTFTGLLLAAVTPRVSAARSIEDRAKEILELERDRRNATDPKTQAADTRRIERLERSARDAAGVELRSDLGERQASIRESRNGADIRVIDGREIHRTMSRSEDGERGGLRGRDSAGDDDRRGLRDRTDSDDDHDGLDGDDRDGSDGGAVGDDGSGGGDLSDD